MSDTTGEPTPAIPPEPKTTAADLGAEFIAQLAEGEARKRANVLEWYVLEQLNDTGNAAFFADKYQGRARYTVGRGWLVWDGIKWAEDANNATVTRYMRDIAGTWFDVAKAQSEDGTRKAISRHANNSLNHSGLTSSLKEASKWKGILTTDADFDTDMYALNCQNGIVNLRTGDVTPHDPDAMCTRVAGVDYDPDANSDRWGDRGACFLAELFGQDESLVTFVRRWLGYCLTGRTTEQRYMIAYGGGNNGKSTLWSTIDYILGDYVAHITPASLAARGESSNVNTDIAKLPGARLAICPEWSEDMNANESMLKDLTGGDKITVRTLYKEPFTFTPQVKIVIYGNHRPKLKGTDDGTWRRPLFTPFTRKFSKDAGLVDTLQAEGAGILADLVQACIEWQRGNDLAIPDAVIKATGDYRAASNDVAKFIDECCVKADQARATVGALHKAYKSWGGGLDTSRKLGDALRELGYETTRTMYGYQVIGLGLETTSDKNAKDSTTW